MLTINDLPESLLTPYVRLEHFKKLINELKPYHTPIENYQIFPFKDKFGHLQFTYDVRAKDNPNETDYEKLQGYYKFVAIKDAPQTISYYADLEYNAKLKKSHIDNRPKNRRYAAKHTDLTHGSDVVFAGYITITPNKTIQLSNESGHYKLNLEDSKRFAMWFTQAHNLRNILLDDFSQDPENAHFLIDILNDSYQSISILDKSVEEIDNSTENKRQNHSSSVVLSNSSYRCSYSSASSLSQSNQSSYRCNYSSSDRFSDSTFFKSSSSFSSLTSSVDSQTNGSDSDESYFLNISKFEGFENCQQPNYEGIRMVIDNAAPRARTIISDNDNQVTAFFLKGRNSEIKRSSQINQFKSIFSPASSSPIGKNKISESSSIKIAK